MRDRPCCHFRGVDGVAVGNGRDENTGSVGKAGHVIG